MDPISSFHHTKQNPDIPSSSQDAFMKLEKRLYSDMIALQSKNLTDFPELTGDQRHNVKELYIDFNSVKSLPDNFANAFRHLSVLSAIGNDIERLPNDIGFCVNLREMYLQENCLTYLPDSITHLLNLTIFNIVGNMIKALPRDIGSLASLQKFYADENLLQELPGSFGNLEQLTVLEVASNKLESIPSSFGKLMSLHTINISGNNLRELPHSFSRLCKVRVLDLSDNTLCQLPSSFASATVLEQFYLSGNIVSWFPDWMGNMPKLVEFAADDNRLTGEVIAEEFGYNCQKLSVLNLAGNYISRLPDSFGYLSSLESLHLGSCIDELERRAFQNGNRLSTLPDTFCRLIKLRYLRLDENKLTCLPQNFGDLCNLEHLDLGQNHLRVVPDSFCRLSSLRYCQLSRNMITTLPDRMDLMTSLKDLRVDNNVVTHLPESMGDMPNLESLDLFHNRLTDPPHFIYRLVKLKRLDLMENHFKLKVKDTPRVWSGIEYPDRDPNLRDNWRGQIRHNKANFESCIIVEGDEDEEEEPDSIPEYNEHLLEMAARRNMSMWRSHTGPAEREKFEQQQPMDILEPLYLNFLPNVNHEPSFGEEDWDTELMEEPSEPVMTSQRSSSEPKYYLRANSTDRKVGRQRLDSVRYREPNPWWDDQESNGSAITDENPAICGSEDTTHTFVPSKMHAQDRVRDHSAVRLVTEAGQFDDAEDEKL